MNKKLLFAAMSLAALTACSTDDFESQQQVAEGVSPIQFEVINNNDGFTRAYMEGSIIHWEASKGDLFTLYHGGTASGTPITLTSYQNATYTAAKGDGAATLTTPSMIKEGKALMIWPVDTAFTNNGAAVAISIPETLDNIENNITYASDLVDIKARTATSAIGDPNTAGYNRKYPVYMRPLTSQLTLKADYAGTESVLDALSTGADPINPIKVTSVDLTNTADKFTQKIALNFTAAGTDDITRWGGDDRDNNWSHITGFATAASTQVKKLTTKVLTGNESAKFLILPKSIADDNTAVVVNTTYGKVVLGKGTSYTTDEQAKAWYKLSGTTKEEKSVKDGMSDVFNGIDNAIVSANTVVKGEPSGASATRYVTVLLNYIDMDGLHITNDKHLYDAVRVWKELGLDNASHKITVYLDGDSDEEFKISQNTIAKINELNAAAAKEETPRSFQVKPCTEHKGNTIVITGGGTIAQDLTFIVANGTTTVPVALNKGENWKWNSKNVTVDATATGIKSIINRGTFTSDATATLKIMNNATTPAQVSEIGFENALGATWDITAGDINVQFNVTNNGTVNIAKGAEYHQDAVVNGGTTTKTTFTNQAETVPERFYKNDPSISASNKKKFVEKIGQVNNEGVFAALAGRGQIYNYGLIEHADKDAKTYITANQSTSVDFASDFGTSNKMGRINLPIENKDENNVSISATAATGMVSVTVASTVDLKDPSDASGKKYVLKGGALDLSTLGTYVNYCIIKKGVTEITKVASQVKYIEFNDEDNTEIAWNLGGTVTSKVAATYDGLMILSPVNINLTTKITVKKATFLGAKLYVGGEFDTSASSKPYDGYFGKTTKNAATMYITY